MLGCAVLHLCSPTLVVVCLSCLTDGCDCICQCHLLRLLPFPTCRHLTWLPLLPGFWAGQPVFFEVCCSGGIVHVAEHRGGGPLQFVCLLGTMKVGTCNVFSCVAYSLIFFFVSFFGCWWWVAVCFVRWFFRWVTVPASTLPTPCSCSSLNPMRGRGYLLQQLPAAAASQRTAHLQEICESPALFIPPGDSSRCQMIPTSLYCWLVPAVRRFLRSTSSWQFCDLCLPTRSLSFSDLLFCSALKTHSHLLFGFFWNLRHLSLSSFVMQRKHYIIFSASDC